MKKVFEGGELLRSMAKDIALLKGAAREDATDDSKAGARKQKKFKWHHHSDGMMRRVPQDWTFPMLALQHMYQQWHCGNEEKEIPPMKYLQNHDVSFLGRSARFRLNEVKLLMQCIDKAAASNNHKPTKGMALAEANTCFAAGRSGINVSATTPTGKKREVGLLRWTSVMKYMPRKKRAWRATT